MDFNDSHKEEVRASYLGFGVHKVQIIGFNLDKTEQDKEFIEIGFVTEDDIEDKARVWFVGDAAKYSFNTLRTILLHNVPEDKKDVAKKAVDAVANTEKLAELLNSKLIGKEMWVTKYLDDKGRTYEKNGVTYKSINVNVFGFEPKARPDLVPEASAAPAKKESVADAAGSVFGTAESDEPFPSNPPAAPAGDSSQWS